MYFIDIQYNVMAINVIWEARSLLCVQQYVHTYQLLALISFVIHGTYLLTCA